MRFRVKSQMPPCIFNHLFDELDAINFVKDGLWEYSLNDGYGLYKLEFEDGSNIYINYGQNILTFQNENGTPASEEIIYPY